MLPVIVRVLVDLARLVCSAIVATTAVGAVKPDFENLPIPGKQLGQLLAVDIDVRRFAVRRIVSIPRGEVDAELQAMASGGAGDIADHIALTILPVAIADAVLRCLSGPETKTVVVLAGENHTLHPAGLQS